MAKFIFYAVIVWLIFRWMDMLFGRRSKRNNPPPRNQAPQPKQHKKPNSDKVGDYVDFEEVDD